MKFDVGSAGTTLMREPKADAQPKRPLMPGTSLGECIIVNDDWLSVDFGPNDNQKGFVLRADCVSAGDGRPKVARRGVVHKAVLVEVEFNASEDIAPWYVLADFLIARAIIETGVANANSLIPDSDAVGPLQVSTSEWNSFIQNGRLLAVGFSADDRDDPLQQINAAAFRMHADMKAMSGLRTSAGSGDPFVPQFLDVFFAYLTNSPKVALAMRDAMVTSENGAQPISKFFRGPLTDAEVTALHKARARFFGPEGRPKSLGEVVADAKTILDNALQQAFNDIKQFIPEAVPVVSVPEMGGAGATFAEKAPLIMRQLIADFSFKDFQAAAILGNFGRETGGFTLFQERHPTSGRGGIGWAQWTADRRVNFETFCSSRGLDIHSDLANYSFLKHEMTATSEKDVVDKLKGTAAIEAATELFMREYERPGVKALTERITWAKRALNAFNTVGTLGTNAQALVQQINAGKISFDSPELKSELLGLNTGTKISPKLQALILKLSQLAPTLRISSLVRSGTGSHHTEGRAVDIGNEEIAGALLPMVATSERVAELAIDELIFDAGILHEGDRNKFNFDAGAKHNFNEATLNEHGNHIHFAVLA